VINAVKEPGEMVSSGSAPSLPAEEAPPINVAASCFEAVMFD